MKLRVVHDTVYDYAPAVETAHHLGCIQPRHGRHQRLLQHQLDIWPEPSSVTSRRDAFGNTVHSFALQEPHRQLRVRSLCWVQTPPSEPVASPMPWEAVRELFTYRAGRRFDPANEFVFASPMVQTHPELADYARPSLRPGRPLQEAAVDLMQRLHADFTYEAHSTEVNTPALTALRQRRGVCQDFAHILIGALRSMGLAASYVSGYLLTQPPPGQTKLRGADATHAWAAVYLPDAPEGRHWLHLDPTNNRAGWPTPGEDYVVVAWGRDFSDVSPLRGVIVGGNSHRLTVGVTVEPMPPDAS